MEDSPTPFLNAKRIFISHDFGGHTGSCSVHEMLKAAGGSEFSFFLASDWNSLASDEAWLHISGFVTQHTLCIVVPAEEPS
jgi:hypothetical protein